MGGAHGHQVVRRGLVVADGQAHLAEHLGHQHRGDAQGADGLAAGVHVLDGLGHVRVDLALGAVKGVAAQVLGCAEAAGNDQGVGRVGREGGQRRDLAAGDAGRLDEHVALLLHLLAGDVVEHVVLLDVRRVAVELGAVLVNGQQGEGCLVDFRAVLVAAAGKEYGKGFLLHESLHDERAVGFQRVAPRSVRGRVVLRRACRRLSDCGSARRSPGRSRPGNPGQGQSRRSPRSPPPAAVRACR